MAGDTWIESGTQDDPKSALLRDFMPPREWGVGVHAKHLYNLYVYFWRWALWKAFEHHPDADRGVICFITVAGFLDGDGFAQMRRWMRQKSDAIWVIDCSPEGHQPAVSSRVFEAVQQPVCIVLALRDGSTGTEMAPVLHRVLTPGNRRDKFTELGRTRLADEGWRPCGANDRAPFTPTAEDRWAGYPALDDLFTYSGSGTMPGRTWIIAPDASTLRERWQALVTARPEDKPDLLSEHSDRRVTTVLRDNLPGYPTISRPIAEESEPSAEPIRIGYRSLDRQWIIPDKRVINRPNPRLWGMRSDRQVYLTAPHDSSPTAGPALTFSALVPDLHHYKGSFGGRAYPLWLDKEAATSNVRSALLNLLGTYHGHRPTGEDVLAYLAAICAHPGYAATFASDLTNPGLRVPITLDHGLFAEVVELGRRVIWLHCYGERFTDPAAGRPASRPRMPNHTGPRVTADHPIPLDPAAMPDEIRHDTSRNWLWVGSGAIENVTAQMSDYEVSGVRILTKWFSYRRRTREHPSMGRRVSRLLDIQADRWLPEYTRELIDLLHVIGLLIDLEPAQADALDRVLASPLLDAALLTPATQRSSGTPGPSEDGTVPLF